MNILIRNLTKAVTERELLLLFQPFGEIKSHNIVLDQATGHSKGFGFVEMPDKAEATAAIKALNGKLVRGQKIRVKTTSRESSPVQDSPERERPERFEGWAPRLKMTREASTETKRGPKRPAGGTTRPSGGAKRTPIKRAKRK